MELIVSAVDVFGTCDYVLSAAGMIFHRSDMSSRFTATGLVVRHHNLPDLVPGGESAWNSLLLHSSCETVCLHWKWMTLWRKYFYRQDMQAVVIGVYDVSELVGLLPLVLVRNDNARLSKRRLCFFGTGEPEAEEITTEYIDVIAKTGYEKLVCDAAANYLYTVFTDWDLLELPRYKKDSLINNHLLSAMHEYGARQHVYTSGYRHYITLKPHYRDYVAERSKSFRRNLVNGTNTLNAMGKVEHREITTHEEIEGFIQALKFMHLKRFRSMHRISAFESKAFTSYHRDILHDLLDCQQVMMLVCERDNEIISAEYVMLLGRNAYAYQGSFDKNIAKVSMGFLSINKAIEIVTNKGFCIFDFMLGSEDSYATSYGCQRESMYTAVIYNRHIHNYFSYLKVIMKIHLKGAWVIGKGIFEKMSEWRWRRKRNN